MSAVEEIRALRLAEMEALLQVRRRHIPIQPTCTTCQEVGRLTRDIAALRAEVSR